MNILYCFTFDYSLKTWNDSGSLDRELYYFQKHYEQNGTKHTLLTYGGKEDYKFLPDTEYLKIIPIYEIIKYSNNKIIRFIKSFFIPFFIKNLIIDIDVIKQNQLNGSWVPMLMKIIYKKPLYIRTGYDMYEFSILENKSRTKKLFFLNLTKLALKFSDLYSVTSRSDQNFLSNNFHLKNSKLLVRPNWINFNKTTSKKHHQNTLVSVGRLEKQKNYLNLLEMLSGSNLSLHIYGNGSEKNNLINFSKNNNLDLNIFNVIPNEKLRLNLTKYSIFISNSIYEGNPKTILEAMAVGCVVVASNIKNHSEIIENGKTGVLFEKDDDLQKILKDLLSNNLKMKFLSDNALEYVKNNHHIDDLISKEIEDIKNIVGC